LGVETTGYLLLLNSPQALQHFSAGTSFALSANLFGGLGGWLGLSPYTYTQAASLPSNTASWCGPYPNHQQYMDGNNGTLVPDDDEYNDFASTHTVLKVGESSSSNTDGSNSFNSMNMTSVAAPMVAYTVTAQGVYMGVSLEGSRIVARNDINRRVYQFSCGQQQQHSGATTSGVTSTELLTGKLTTPQEAESLYQALYQLEYQYECRQLPTKPTLQPSMQPADNATHSGWRAQDVPMINLNPVVVQKFQDWLQGGVPIRTTMTTTTTTGGGGSKLVKTLWLSIPKTMTTTTATASSHDNDNHNNGARNASLRLGLVHTPQDSQIMDDADGGGTVASEDVTLDSALLDNKVRNVPTVRHGVV
jgi:lipid-binding SYLF domain-containing protein